MWEIRVVAHGKNFTIRPRVSSTHVNLTYEYECYAEADDGEIVDFRVRFTSKWVASEQQQGNLPQNNSPALSEALQRMALDEVKQTLAAAKRPQRIIIKADGPKEIENL